MYFTEHFFKTIEKEGVVSIVTTDGENPHASNTWNSYLVIAEDNKILIPAAGMLKTEKNYNLNQKVILTLGSHEVEGYRSMGTGYYLEGSAKFYREGESEHFDMMKEKYPFLSRVLEITVTNFKQTL